MAGVENEEKAISITILTVEEHAKAQRSVRAACCNKRNALSRMLCNGGCIINRPLGLCW